MKEEFEKLPLRNVGGGISSVWTFSTEKFDLFVPFLPEHSHYVANLPSDGNLHLDRVKKHRMGFSRIRWPLLRKFGPKQTTLRLLEPSRFCQQSLH